MAAAAHGGLSPAPAPRLLALGDAAWTVEFGAVIEPALHARVLALAAAVRAACVRAEAPWTAVEDVVPTFRSLTVHHDPLAGQGLALGQALLALAQQVEAVPVVGRRWVLPACFDPALAPDLGALAARQGLPPAAVIDALLQTELRVYQIGFMPGFPYMAGVPPALQVPRLPIPRKAVPPGSIALAGAMCAVYPWESPGGWHLIGRTPALLWDLRRTPPALLASGDTVRWCAVDRATYDRLLHAARSGELDPAVWCETPGGYG
ncbi:MAG: allophanate hydrolase subunit 1 [Tepidimonas sp.]|uniref:5-oxoprolinase subunit B family protein n=1 Tax=Tepidimonas sp. TaxID=2002775 RepID=UPI00298ED984|nr:allophanate hydrolase subunit 1 [Tepidimonas sp.]MCS6811470.1 allophanate hydrolase subunit 1 [Tepidimonas sp.]MDW8335886.1 allophanate hydrolase subunit 1 [Tepidimonas sp.]